MFGVSEAMYLLEKYKDRPKLIYGDPDVDGLEAMRFCCELYNMLGFEYSYYINENRGHGFFINPEQLRGYLVIAVDFDLLEELDSLIENDVVVICIDHHDIDCERVLRYNNKGDLVAVVINNQYYFEPEDNRYQSGAGVVYEAFCEMTPAFRSEEREAIVGITLLSDIRPIENPKARYYLERTYNIDTSKGYMNYLVTETCDTDFKFGFPRMDYNYITYTLAPTINSLLRYNFNDAAIDFVLGKGLKIKGTRKMQSELLTTMKEQAQYLEMEYLTVVALEESLFDSLGVNLTNFIGYMASSIKGTGKSILAFTHRSGVVSRASFRARYTDVAYRPRFLELGLDAQGHAFAFGILNFKPTGDIWEKINTIVGECDRGHTQTIKVLEVSNLSFLLLNKGYNIAKENCYVRDAYRTYIRYIGNKAKMVKRTFKIVPFTAEDERNRVRPVKIVDKVKHKYKLENGEKVAKYIEYNVDGVIVKSFGTPIEEGLILPTLEKDSLSLYVREVSE